METTAIPTHTLRNVGRKMFFQRPYYCCLVFKNCASNPQAQAFMDPFKSNWSFEENLVEVKGVQSRDIEGSKKDKDSKVL